MENIYTLFDSLFYLTISILIALIYMLVFIGTILYARECFTKKKVVALDKILLKRFFSSTSLKFFLLFFVGFNYFMYSSQRSEWINKNTLHHNAKEYFVAYIPIAFYKKVFGTIFPVDSIIVKPFNIISKILYEKGISLLPDNDGEKYFWKYKILYYWYVRGQGYMPGDDTYHPKPITKEQQYILDEMFDIVKGLATSKIKDKVINKEKYKAFIASEKYYYTYSLLPYNKYIINYYSDSERAALKDKNFIRREKDMLGWTLRFQKEYRRNKSLTKVIEKEIPILGVSYDMIISQISEEMIFKMIIDNRLKCNSKYIDIYKKSLNNLISKGSPLYKLSKSQQTIIKDFIFNHYISYFDKYMLYKKCNLKIETGYPSKKWIREKFPLIKKRWINKNNSLDINDTIVFDFNITNTNFTQGVSQ